MTGFGKGESSNDRLCVSAEIKSVNHRFKDFRFRTPSAFNPMEIGLKKDTALTLIFQLWKITSNWQKELTTNLKKQLNG